MRAEKLPRQLRSRLMPHRIKILCLSCGWLLLFFFLLPLPSSESAPHQKEDFRKPLVVAQASVTFLEDGAYRRALQGAIDKAIKEITLSFFSFKIKGDRGGYPDVIVARLAEAAKRGVKVVVLLERGRDPGDSTSRENRRTMEILQQQGVSVFLDAPERTTHTKIVVIDGKYTFIGSHNLTQSALKYNNEVSVMIESTQAAAEALNYIRSLLPGG